MIRLLTVLALAALAGCTSLSPTVAVEEGAWQAANVIDAGQTATIARSDGRWVERDPTTRALIGVHPTEKSVLYTMAGYALIHFGVTEWLSYEDSERPGQGWGVALQCFEVGSLAYKGYDVIHNNSVGIKQWESTKEAQTWP